ncbi:MAG TPA: hypothetical protein VGR95_01635 [Thermoanaerobaculia bacterium]|nr:hypothetical protein [Thermoanaerobaculia bacterium]
MPPIVRLPSYMCERDDLQVVGPIAVDHEEGKVSQWKTAYAAVGTPNDFADRRMFGDEIHNRLYVVPEPVAQTT